MVKLDTQQPETQSSNLRPDHAAQQILKGEPTAAYHAARVILQDTAPDMDYLQRLHASAETLAVANGWSGIPVWGDLESGSKQKTATVNWKAYQQRLPTPDERQEWFLERGFPGLAIVCGDVSGGLVVLDCDTPQIAAAFRDELPGLTKTYTVLSATKQLPHYYFRLPDGESLSFAGKKGVCELRGNGHYVVTYPTIINGNLYKLARGGNVLKLSANQLKQIHAFLNRHSAKTSQAAPDHSPDLISTDQDANQRLIDLYHQQVQQHSGRNDGLFYTAMVARNNGWQLSAALFALQSAHINHQPLREHPPETPEQRATEARNTVQSAFKQPPHTSAHDADLKPLQLPTSIREFLLKTGQHQLARLLDALYMVGCLPGHTLNASDIIQLCKQYKIGHATIKRILKENTALRLVNLSELQGSECAADIHELSMANQTTYQQNKLVSICHSNSSRTTYCISEGDKPGLNSKRGRKPMYYRVPSISELCTMFGVEDIGRDILTAGDLVSIVEYRNAVHETLIKRRPSVYSKPWLADRLGVHPRTISRYNANNPSIIVERRTDRRRLSFDNIPMLDELPKYGNWVEDETGKKHPPRREVAVILLKAGRTVHLVWRLTNRYDHVDNRPDITKKSA